MRVASFLMDAFLASCAGCVNNPVVPLSCEWLGGVIDAPQTPGLQTMPGVSLWTASVEQGFDAWPSGEHDYVSSKVATASSKCLPGLALAPAQAARVAGEAERLSPRIIPPDVFNVRALRCAATLDEALALYVKACEAAPLTLKDYVLEKQKLRRTPKTRLLAPGEGSSCDRGFVRSTVWPTHCEKWGALRRLRRHT